MLGKYGCDTSKLEAILRHTFGETMKLTEVTEPRLVNIGSVCLSVSLAVCVCVCLSVCMYVHMYVCIYVCMYVRLYVCLFVCNVCQLITLCSECNLDQQVNCTCIQPSAINFACHASVELSENRPKLLIK